MDAAAIIEMLSRQVPGASCEVGRSIDMPAVYVPAGRLVDVGRALHDDPSLRFTVLIEITAADYLPRAPRFEVVYHLLSISNRLRLRVKVQVPDGATIPTVQGVWPAAGWLERELFDMFGIFIDGHPDLRRLLMPEDWEGHPARKDYPVQIRKAAQTYSALEVSVEEFQANLERDRAKRPR